MTVSQIKTFRFLNENLALLDQSVKHLAYSFNKCLSSDLSGNLSEEELEALEALAARFARTSDIFTQKVLVSLLQLLQEDHPTFIDRMNFCEKIGVISSANILYEIRALRNAIAHEYRQTNLTELYGKILENKPALTESINMTTRYIDANFKAIN